LTSSANTTISSTSSEYQYSTNFQGIVAIQSVDPSSYITACSIAFFNPMETLLSTMRELAFRTALQVASTSTANTTITYPYTALTSVTIYTTNQKWLRIASIFAAMGILCLLPLYNGYWNLGRKVSMSPLEIVRAFDVNLLKDVNANADVEGILKEVGNDRVV
jgi:hypothetical protein